MSDAAGKSQRRADAVEIDPIDLKLGEGTYQNTRLNGVFSSLRDANPDYWGRYLIERHSGNTGLSEIDYLLESPDDRVGARPKAVVEDVIGLWVAKFGRPDDRWNNPRVEHAMLELARSCGINAARSRIESVGGKDVLLVQRFDRERTSNGYFRARMISGLTLLRAEESVLKRER